jgi:hypothetical protein
MFSPLFLFSLGMAALTLGYLYLMALAPSSGERLLRLIQVVMMGFILGLVIYSGAMSIEHAAIVARV